MLIEDYQFLKESFGDVIGRTFLAEHTQSGERVFIKTLYKNLARDREVVQVFHRCAKFSTKLRSDAFTRTISYGSERGKHYLIYQHFDLLPLTSFLESQNVFSIFDAPSLVERLAMALRTLHINGEVHGILSPDCVFVDRKLQTVKIGNFGFEKLIRVLLFNKHAEIEPCLPYFSPEINTGQRHLHRQSDVYSLGVLLYRLLVGDTPWQEANMESFLRGQPEGSIIPPSLQRLEVPDVLDQVVMHALEANVDDRCANLSLFIKQLAEAKSDILASFTPTTAFIYGDEEEAEEQQEQPHASERTPRSAPSQESAPEPEVESTPTRDSAKIETPRQASDPVKADEIVDPPLPQAQEDEPEQEDNSDHPTLPAAEPSQAADMIIGTSPETHEETAFDFSDESGMLLGADPPDESTATEDTTDEKLPVIEEFHADEFVTSHSEPDIQQTEETHSSAATYSEPEPPTSDSQPPTSDSQPPTSDSQPPTGEDPAATLESEVQQMFAHNIEHEPAFPLLQSNELDASVAPLAGKERSAVRPAIVANGSPPKPQHAPTLQTQPSGPNGHASKQASQTNGSRRQTPFHDFDDDDDVPTESTEEFTTTKTIDINDPKYVGFSVLSIIKIVIFALIPLLSIYLLIAFAFDLELSERFSNLIGNRTEQDGGAAQQLQRSAGSQAAEPMNGATTRPRNARQQRQQPDSRNAAGNKDNSSRNRSAQNLMNLVVYVQHNKKPLRADVYLDGQYAGKTNDRGRLIIPGLNVNHGYLVKIQKRGYQLWVKEVRARSPGNNNLIVDLQSSLPAR